MFSARLIGRTLWQDTPQFVGVVTQRFYHVTATKLLLQQLPTLYDSQQRRSISASKCTTRILRPRRPRPPRIVLKIIPASKPLNLSYDERNEGRELSPHLRIYKPQITSVMSILLRISGFGLAVGVWIIGLTGLFSDKTLLDWAVLAESLELTATRHLIWHLNIFLSKSEIYTTGYVAIAMTLLLSLALAFTTVKPLEELPKEVIDLVEPDNKSKKKQQKPTAPQAEQLPAQNKKK